ncbi:MAG: hypothetical protein R2799_07745 [Crocinitomicaceae bacterium]
MRFLILFLIALLGNAQIVKGNEASFFFDDLVYMIDGREVGSQLVPDYENLSVGVKGITGYLIEDGLVELGMEVVITDVNSNRLLYSPDMLENTKLNLEEVSQVHFDINLNEDFQKDEEYFIKIKMWDKKTKKSFSKHSSFKITDPLRNENVYVDVRRLNVAGYKFYINGDRLYTSNYIRLGDELVIDMFFKELEIEQDEDIVIITEMIDEQNSTKMILENDFVIKDKNEMIKSVLIKSLLYDTSLKPDESYIFHMQFHNASRNQKLDMKFRIVLMDSDWKVDAEKVPGVNMEVRLNNEPAKTNPVLEIGDRLDFELSGFWNKQRSDFGFGKIGGRLMVFDAQGKKVFHTKDVFSQNAVYVLNSEKTLAYKFVVPSTLLPNGKYTVELELWDKYSHASTQKKFIFKTSKEKIMPYGLNENLFLRCKFMEGKIRPVAVFVNQNGYKVFKNNLNASDEIELITSIELMNGQSSNNLMRYVELYDEKGELLIRDEEAIKDFQKGEIIASMIIPEEGIEYNRNYTLVAILEDGIEELMKVEYTFYIEQ